MALEIVNQGFPIGADHLPRLFERFYRVDESRTRDFGGTGLGLAIAKAIMQMHGGMVIVSNSPEGKIRFALLFPSRAKVH